jgi:hypothetical protein
MTIPSERTDPADPRFDAYRTANLEDPELAAAYEAENEAVRLDGESIGLAWALGLIPFMLVLLLLSAALGDWVWDLMLPLFLAGAACVALVRFGLFRRFVSELPMHIPGYGVFTGTRKRRLLLKAGALAVVLLLANQLHLLGVLQRWFVDWVATL